MNISELIKEAHDNAVEKGFYDCPECGNPPVSCIGAGQCDHDGTECTPEKNCGEYEPICQHCNGTGKDQNRNIGELLMLIVSELGEALDAQRAGRFCKREFTFINGNKGDVTHLDRIDYEHNAKDTFEDELADVFIRLFDMCGYLEEPLTEITEQDKNYNIPENLGEFFIQAITTLLHGFRNSFLHMLWAFCYHNNIPIEKHIKAKMKYNRTRPHKHGKAY